MATQTKSVGTIVEGDVWGYGSLSWGNLPELSASDNSYATVTAISPNGPYPNTPICFNFGFTIPAGASIDKITVKIEAKTDVPGVCALDWCGLMYLGSPSILHAYCQSEVSDIAPDGPLTDSDVVYSINPVFAGDGDLWGHPWTVGEVNHASFGCAFDAYIPDNVTLSVEHVQRTIDYTEENEPESICHELACGTGEEFFEQVVVNTISKVLATECAGLKISPTIKTCDQLTDLIDCGTLYNLEEAFKAALTDDGCGGQSLRVFVLQQGRDQ